MTGQTVELRSDAASHGHEHDHDHHHDRHEDHVHVDGKTIVLQEAVLAKNDRLAERNRGWLQGRHVVALNLVSSPGSGKTTLLEQTIRALSHELRIQVIEGDQATVNDAERIRSTGCRVVQINTGVGCHLEADMVARGLEQLAPVPDSIVMIENVGNLVCPALFDLGEQAKVVVLSVTEGEDKPLKYPHMFRAAQVLLLNKIDLLPHLSFDVTRCIEYAKSVNPHLEVFLVSAISGEGMQSWYKWLRAQVQALERATAC
ncbi:Hydrogenase nickel incorporation protein HypB [Nitrospira moscoviensis]|uniref:Hydrogenase nickel incorporation protein n=2 Tax=Nitrospira moscoviensis TaxID=42253 RepID=A0A088ND36_NITMO|nr:hydrogenase nickel incorporation protein HypB [Nitrospira moscoviensis]AIN51374.1 hydrogenase nickel incorporation protein [Nitrospira moscoviensis]ALA58080.1 Hydrogenase nickel incorporation protein HypB [Nitrospira moscoviensis]